MKKINTLLLLLAMQLASFAQVENLSILKSNSALYHQSLPFQNQLKVEYIDNNQVITYTPIALPFVDDFSKNTLKPFTFNENNVTDTISYATGSCIVGGDFTTENIGLSLTQAYYYFYDVANNRVDSVATAPISVLNFSNSTCFPHATDTTNYWKAYYRSTATDFNTSTGQKLDSTLITPDTIMQMARIYFATMPNHINWTDNYAWWNTTNPINPITIGVATLDGLNEFGLPYNNDVTNAYGIADYLTSKPIDLRNLGVSSNTYLSFFYQAGGLGDFPNAEDSLVVEFKGADGVWKRKWSTRGINQLNFNQTYIPLFETNFDSLLYAIENFQFRFKNYASLSGNNDLWHIDYVRLDQNRNPNSLDTVIRDVAVLYDFPNYLKNYSLLPWRQMQAGTDQFADTIQIAIRDNGQVEGIQAGAFPIDVNIDNSVNADIIYNESGSSFNPQLNQEIKEHTILPFTNFTLPSISGADSLLFNTLFYIAPIDRNALKQNDTLRSEILFHNILAYDDGSAELAYGIEGGGTEVKKFAYEFNIATQDTLAGIQVHFSNIDQKVEDLVFSFYVWDSLEINGSLAYENVVRSIVNQKPKYINKKNGFATFVLDTPLIVNNKFYIGWAQTDNRNLQIGYDLNSTKGREHMFVYSGNVWAPSTVSKAGSPMLRAILDGDYPIPTPVVAVPSLENIKIYPNPTQNILYIDMPALINHYEVAVYNNIGKKIHQNENAESINTSEWNKGIYFLQIRDLKSQAHYKTTFVVW